MLEQDERMFGMLIYLSSIFTAFIGPLIIWMMKRDESEFVDYHGKEYFNFLISFAIYGVASGILMIVLIGFVLIFVVGLLGFIFTIIAMVNANNGVRYRIPLTFRLIK